MKDEEYLFHADVRGKKNIARSARNTRTHCGKSGRVKFPSDYMTKKELNAMNGEVKSYRLNEPMSWKEFKELPDDIKVTYIKLLREKFHCFDSAVAEMMGVTKGSICGWLFATMLIATLMADVSTTKRKQSKHGTGGQKMANEKRLIWDEDAQHRIVALAVKRQSDYIPLDMITYILFNDTPTVDAVEVVHGRWEIVHGVLTPGGDPLLRCPICKSRESEHLCGIECRTVWNYCPVCGAKMDGDGNG